MYEKVRFTHVDAPFHIVKRGLFFQKQLFENHVKKIGETNI